jgi:hypothetical protein
MCICSYTADDPFTLFTNQYKPTRYSSRLKTNTTEVYRPFGWMLCLNEKKIPFTCRNSSRRRSNIMHFLAHFITVTMHIHARKAICRHSSHACRRRAQQTLREAGSSRAVGHPVAEVGLFTRGASVTRRVNESKRECA